MSRKPKNPEWEAVDKSECPFCGSYPMEPEDQIIAMHIQDGVLFKCGNAMMANGSTLRSPRCYENEITNLRRKAYHDIKQTYASCIIFCEMFLYGESAAGAIREEELQRSREGYGYE